MNEFVRRVKQFEFDAKKTAGGLPAVICSKKCSANNLI